MAVRRIIQILNEVLQGLTLYRLDEVSFAVIHLQSHQDLLMQKRYLFADNVKKLGIQPNDCYYI